MQDDVPLIPNKMEEPGRYWREEEWERSLLENERLMDRYQKAFEEDPERRWDDPLDLYYKVQHGIDFGKDVKFPEKAREAEEERPESGGGSSEEPWHGVSVEDDPASLRDDLESIPAYRLGLEFSMAIHDYLKGSETGGSWEDPLRMEFYRHALRIGAEIAGGHGLGYEEDTLCGNIVKNRWALGHAREAARLLQILLQGDGSSESLKNLLSMVHEVQKEIESRVVELRRKVWW